MNSENRLWSNKFERNKYRVKEILPKEEELENAFVNSMD